MTKALSLIGLPYLFGLRQPSPRNAMALGPRALLSDKNFITNLEQNFGDLSVELIEDADDPSPEQTAGYYDANVIGLFAGDQMSRVMVQNMRLARSVAAAHNAKRLPLVANGTCTSALGMVAGLGSVENLGMIWFDAHDDAETPETSTSGLIEGMPVSMIAGKCWQAYCRQIPGFRIIPEEHIVSIGLHEKYLHKPKRGLRALGQAVDPDAIARSGFDAALSHALDRLRSYCQTVYIHVDVDVLDPSVLKASHHIANGGLTADQLRYAFTSIANRFEIAALDFSSFDPTVDPKSVSVIAPLMLDAALAMKQSRRCP
ncbi:MULTISPECIES: arginase family protein [Agrobacterium tumefaciens complex]|uniref:arginase family protein n=1 Tax=Agrobacterium tumefaciens TaxID=358 RepID=UPI001E3C6084|nr:arginase family protein [Agrobacterium tumefaciens]